MNNIWPDGFTPDTKYSLSTVKPPPKVIEQQPMVIV